jgi:hypothetical protein
MGASETEDRVTEIQGWLTDYGAQVRLVVYRTEPRTHRGHISTFEVDPERGVLGLLDELRDLCGKGVYRLRPFTNKFESGSVLVEVDGPPPRHYTGQVAEHAAAPSTSRATPPPTADPRPVTVQVPQAAGLDPIIGKLLQEAIARGANAEQLLLSLGARQQPAAGQDMAPIVGALVNGLVNHQAKSDPIAQASTLLELVGQRPEASRTDKMIDMFMMMMMGKFMQEGGDSQRQQAPPFGGPRVWPGQAAQMQHGPPPRRQQPPPQNEQASDDDDDDDDDEGEILSPEDMLADLASLPRAQAEAWVRRFGGLLQAVQAVAPQEPAPAPSTSTSTGEPVINLGPPYTRAAGGK